MVPLKNKVGWDNFVAPAQSRNRIDLLFAGKLFTSSPSSVLLSATNKLFLAIKTL